MISNAAFDLLRKHKEVKPETENLVIKQIKNKVTAAELFDVFEAGISGKYGKLYSADVQTLVGWVNAYLKTKNSARNYLQTGLASVNMNINEIWDWEKEANKCYTAFLNGTPETDFHHGVYDNMMLDGKIERNAYLKFYDGLKDGDPDNELQWAEVMRSVTKAKQKCLKNLFSEFRHKGYSTVYFIN